MMIPLSNHVILCCTFKIKVNVVTGSHIFARSCADMHGLFDPSGLFMSIYYVVLSRYASVVVFALPRLSLSFVLSLLSRPSLQTRVTLLRQMAFCLAELHLWSTKSSLQVKGSTYHHVQSLLFFFFYCSLNNSLSLWLLLSSLTLFSHLLPTLPISTLTIWLCQHNSSLTPSLFTFSLLSPRLFIALYSSVLIMFLKHTHTRWLMLKVFF